MIGLKPCPFCGAKESDGLIAPKMLYPHPFAKSMVIIECRKCGAYMTDSDKKACIEDVIKKWNTRMEDYIHECSL